MTFEEELQKAIRDRVDTIQPFTQIPEKELEQRVEEEARPQALLSYLDDLMQMGLFPITERINNISSNAVEAGYYFLFYAGGGKDCSNNHAYLCREPVLEGNSVKIQLAYYGNGGLHHIGQLEFIPPGPKECNGFRFEIFSEGKTDARKILSVFSKQTGISFSGMNYNIEKPAEMGLPSNVTVRGTYRFREEKDSRGDEK